METLNLEFFETIFHGVKSFGYEEVKQEQEAGTSKCYFITLNYNEENEEKEKNKPKKLFGKFQLPNTEDKENMMNIFEREALHYNVLLNPLYFSELNARNNRPHPFYLPKVFYSSSHPLDKKLFVFLFEDLRETNWVCGDQLVGCDIETAKLVLTSAASFHARWWNSPIEQIEKKYPIMYNLDYISTPLALSSFFESVYPSFIEKFSDRLSSLDDLDTKFQLLSEAIIPILEYFTDRNQRPKTIVHGDLRLDNLFFREKKNKKGEKEKEKGNEENKEGNEEIEKEMAIIDWQLSHVSSPVRDLGKFLILNVNCSFHDQENLVRFYCDQLQNEFNKNNIKKNENNENNNEKNKEENNNKEEEIITINKEEILKDFHKFSYIIIVSSILAWNTLCEGPIPSSLDYLVNVNRLKLLYQSWIDRIIPYLVSDDYFNVAENLALDARAYDQFLSDKYDQNNGDDDRDRDEKRFSKIVIALKPFDDQTPWEIIHRFLIFEFKFDGFIKWINLKNDQNNNENNNNNNNNNKKEEIKEGEKEKEEKEGEKGGEKEEFEMVFGKGPYGMKIAKYCAIVDNFAFSIESFFSFLEEKFEDYLQEVQLISSDDIKDISEISSLKSI